MQYMMILLETPAQIASRQGPGAPAYWAGWKAYFDEVGKSGLMKSGAALQPVTTATTVRVKGGKTHVQDGPFADSKEQLGGYYILEAPSLDVALEWAAKCPAAHGGAVEVRPILPMN